MTSYDRPVTRALYLALLDEDEPSPFLPRSDEEAEDDEEGEEGGSGDGGGGSAEPAVGPGAVRPVQARRARRRLDRFRGHRPTDHRRARTAPGRLRRTRARARGQCVRHARWRLRRRGTAQVLRGGQGGGGLRRAGDRGNGVARPRAPPLPVRPRLARRGDCPRSRRRRRPPRLRRDARPRRAHRRVCADAPRRLALHARLPLRRQPARGAVG